jgi:hypothetical protein
MHLEQGGFDESRIEELQVTRPHNAFQFQSLIVAPFHNQPPRHQDGNCKTNERFLPLQLIGLGVFGVRAVSIL